MATISKSVTVSNGGVYTIELNAIPDGSTVTPVNDIQIWLHCADIWDKNYTTLDEVLADAGVLQALMASNNAIDYMARSTAWAGSLIPKMTSTTAPSGTVTASASYGSDQLTYGPFDRDDATFWQPLSGTTSQTGTGWIQYEFPSVVSIGAFKWTCGCNSKSDKEYPFVMTIETSTDGSTYTTAYTYTQSSSNVTPASHDAVLNNLISAKYVRISFDRRNVKASNGYYYIHLTDFEVFAFKGVNSIVTHQNAMTYIGANNYCANELLSDITWRGNICYSTYFESVLNTKVPTMTSNTTPSGEVAASSYYNSSSEGTYYPWGAFRNPPIKAMPSPNSGYAIGGNWGWCSSGSTGAWVRYKFLQPVCINRVDYAGCSWSASWAPKIQGSNNGNSWTDIATLPSPGQNTTDPLTTHFANSKKYLYIRAYNPSGNFQNRNGVQFQFYGRS